MLEISFANPSTSRTGDAAIPTGAIGSKRKSTPRAIRVLPMRTRAILTNGIQRMLDHVWEMTLTKYTSDTKSRHRDE